MNAERSREAAPSAVPPERGKRAPEQEDLPDIDSAGDFEDPTRAAPIGPTKGAHLRDLTGTPNEDIQKREAA